MIKEIWVTIIYKQIHYSEQLNSLNASLYDFSFNSQIKMQFTIVLMQVYKGIFINFFINIHKY